MKVNFHGEDLPSSREYNILGGNKLSWHIPEEIPVAFVYNRRNYAVMMATPDDLTDFAVGFSLTENIVRQTKDIISLDVFQSAQGVDLRFKISNQALEKLDMTQRRRNLVGSASCGVCGLENADVLFRKLQPVSDKPITLNYSAVVSAIKMLRDHQPLGNLTRTVHAAAWSDRHGDLNLVREDVGRHNALDKLLGALKLEKVNMKSGFVVMSSRCSYEIVEKAASQGVCALVSLSAPTAFALRKAEEAKMTVYANSQTGPIRLL